MNQRSPYSWANYLLGANIVVWGLAGAWLAVTEEGLSTVRVCVTVLNLLVGLLILLRKTPLQRLRLHSKAWWLPALLCTGAIFKYSQPFSDWGMLPVGLFVCGTVMALWSLGTLGGSFTIRPAAVPLVQRGPYRLVRHPAYTGELLMVLACVVARFDVWLLCLLAGLLLFQVLRILEEERVMAAGGMYGSYKETTRWRLLPWVW